MLLVRVKVGQAESRDIRLKSGATKRVAEQVGIVEIDDEVRKIRLPIDIEGGQKPYEPGVYALAPSSFTVGKFHDLQVNPYELRLVPVSVVVDQLRGLKAA
jgi:Helix-destabilising protein